MQDEDDFTVVDRRKRRKLSTEMSGCKQQAQRGTGHGNEQQAQKETGRGGKQQAQRGTGLKIDYRRAPPGIAKLWVSLPKKDVEMTKMSQRITRIVGERRVQGITIKRRHSRNGYTTPYEIYGPHEVIKILSDPCHWEKKSWIAIYTKRFQLPTDYGADEEDTLKMGMRQSSPVNPEHRKQNV